MFYQWGKCVEPAAASEMSLGYRVDKQPTLHPIWRALPGGSGLLSGGSGPMVGQRTGNKANEVNTAAPRVFMKWVVCGRRPIRAELSASASATLGKGDLV